MIEIAPMPDADHLLDTQGLKCPEPVMLLHAQVRKAAPGEVILMLATDPSTERDVPKFCQFLGHTLEQVEQQDGVWRYRVRKKK